MNSFKTSRLYFTTPLAVLVGVLFSFTSPAEELPEAPYSAMTPEEIRAFEIEVMEKVADLALIPPVPNTSPLPEYDYDKLDYGMTIGIERTPGGRLWACWVAGGDSPAAYFVLATSDDNGETWSKPRLVLDSHSESLPKPRSILVGNLWTDPKGRLWLIHDQSMDMFDGRAGVWVTICEDPDADEPEWSTPRRIWHGVTLNKPTVLSTGGWMMPISLDQRGGFGPFKGCFTELDPFRGANVFVSNDEGATWERRGMAAFPNPDWHEHMIVERKGGDLWMLARTGKGIMESVSNNGGKDWTDPVPSAIKHPNARFHIRRLQSGKLLLIKHGDKIDSHEGRVQLSAWVSEDGGQTWSGGLVLDERKGISYPDGFQATDGTIFISYDRNRSRDGEILLARFTEEDVVAGTLVSENSKLKILISRPLAGESKGEENKKEADNALPQPALGTYHWANGTVGVDAFATWLGRETVWGLDFIGWESWDNIGWPTWWLENWSGWKSAHPDRRFILSVPMLAGPVDGSGPTEGAKGVGVPVSLEEGANGEYNQHFRDLAENLVRHNLTDTILRPGWEFNGDWYPWKAKDKTEFFIEYWRQIVTTMRSVEGAENLRFCWNPTLGDQQFPAEEAWPGDDYVDFVGVDVYDETWMEDSYPWPEGSSDDEITVRRQRVWTDWIIGSNRGLQYWTTFAKSHHKPLAIPEWGLVWATHNHGGLDNVHFIEQMHRFLLDPQNNVAFHCYFDINTDDLGHQLSPGVPDSGKDEKTRFPKSAKRFRELFGVGR